MSSGACILSLEEGAGFLANLCSFLTQELTQ